MCKRDIQETCDKIIPFDSTKIFKYTNIAGADKKRKDTSTEKIKEFINNPNFDVNVENPNTGRSVLYTLTYSDPHHFYDYIKKLLENKKTKIDLDIISLLTSRYILDDEIIKLFKKNKKAKKMLKEFT
jgi:predicted CopG family antitoxin